MTWRASGSKLRCAIRSLKRRFFVISKSTRTLVFTDLDGALLDAQSYSWTDASRGLDTLRRRRIPLIFCTSKTRTEVKALRRAMGNTHPFVVENGGAIVIPPGYFPELATLGNRGKAYTLILGRPYEELVRELKRIADEIDVSVRGFHQMTDEGVARDTGLTVREAHMARQRETSEPFRFVSASQAATRAFVRRAQERGYTVQRGGRFWHFSGSCDKGLAMSVLIGFYRMAWQTRIFTIALGDSANDLPMLRLVDRPILIPRPDGTMDDDVLKAIPRIMGASKPGPQGWSVALMRALQGHKGGLKSAVPRPSANGGGSILAGA
ncbi:MAG TPA: HAD-IIB family hydrolase [Terriglobales bacterium]|nr:HAD-IIB family hydrolase [Terriglobales bacterium]